MSVSKYSLSAARVAWGFNDFDPTSCPMCVALDCHRVAVTDRLYQDGSSPVTTDKFHTLVTKCASHAGKACPLKALPSEPIPVKAKPSKRQREDEEEQEPAVLQTPPPKKKSTTAAKAPDAPKKVSFSMSAEERAAKRKEQKEKEEAKAKSDEETRLNEELDKAKGIMGKVFYLNNRLTEKQADRVKSRFGGLLRMAEDGYLSEEWTAPSHHLYMIALFHVLAPFTEEEEKDGLFYDDSDEDEDEEEKNSTEDAEDDVELLGETQAE